MMDTWIRGCEKRHIGCGGLVRFVENLCQTPEELSACHAEWLFECTECGKMLSEEMVEFDNDVLQEDAVTSECCGAEIIVGDCASECAECGNSVNPATGKPYSVKTACFGGTGL